MRHTSSTLFHITHWKAGSQWILKILEAIAPERIIRPRVGEGQLLLDPIVDGAIYPTAYLTREQYDSIDRPAGSRHFVVLRDLRDTLISGYFSARYSHALSSTGLADLRHQLEQLSLDDGLLYLAETWLRGPALIQASWLQEPTGIFRYEDILTHDLDLMHEALNTVGGLDISTDRLKVAVEANRFDVLTGGRQAGLENTMAHERKGIAGDWQNHFSEKVKQRVEELYGPLLRRYERSTQLSANTYSLPQKPSADEVLASYSQTIAVHPSLPSYAHWLAWELAAFKQISLKGNVLDLGCSDPKFLNLVLPYGSTADGMCTNPHQAEQARLYGRYNNVHADGFSSLRQKGEFDHVFSRGSLVHFPGLENNLQAVLGELKPGGTFACSVVTNRYEEWETLPYLLEISGYADIGEQARQKHMNFHGIQYALPIEQWQNCFMEAGFEVIATYPVVPRVNAQANLIFDALWHAISKEGRPLGEFMAAYVSARPRFLQLLSSSIDALMELESNWEDTAGAVFELRKPQ
ncbi:methyltransferase domain-containing protein [Pseudomonas sp. PDM18]|uniref:methyltransferase domain-containing protein n=1 Tax=unclassified Pseudomonas TaxID=196821 RepID=UPI00177D2F1E|nr:methyltransferase domain-containing protein [Pseudomonas sp. PDM18]MBD9680192.1 methyltransferase domain-containing protein [Pseudomonas sp. PDM18]